MIVIKRKHDRERAFKKTLVLKRCGGALCVRLRFKRSSPAGDEYELEAFNPKVNARRCTRVFYRAFEDRTGKWVLGHQERVERAGTILRGREARVAVPAAVYREFLQVMAELDEAVRREAPTSEQRRPPLERGRWVLPQEREKRVVSRR